MSSEPIYEKIIREKSILVTMRDGVKLAVDLYRPDGPERCPAILSAYPYNKDGFGGASAQPMIAYFTKRGYAFVAADCRGYGASEGIYADFLDGFNGEDLYDLVEWVATQPWCDGKVGMTGMSYGGATALKAASMKPPHLKAIVPVMAPADAYDLVFPGGALNMLGVCGAWCSIMNCLNLMPSFHQDAEGHWQKVWHEHLDNYVPFLFHVLDHMTYNGFWKKGVIQLQKIEVPTYVIGGWRDLLPQALISQGTQPKGPKKLLMGPWIHFLPELCQVAPIDSFFEICRWFDYWLKGMDTGIMDEPPVTLFVEGADVWRFEEEWPVRRAREQAWYLEGDGTMTIEGSTSADFKRLHQINPAVGTAAGLLTVFPMGIDYPQEQRVDDALSVKFDAPPIASDVEIMGEPLCTLFISSSALDDANLVVKLCDVAPNGASSLVSTGWLRASHRKSHEAPTPLRRDEVYEVKIRMWPIAYRFKAGHRIRLSLSCSDFPHVWPTTEPGEVTFHGGKSNPASITLPVAPRPDESRQTPTLQEPEVSLLAELMFEWVPEWRVVRDYADNRLSVESGLTAKLNLPAGGEFSLDHHHWVNLMGEGPWTPTVDFKTVGDVNANGNTYVFYTEGEMTQSKVEIKAKVVQDGEVYYEKEFTKQW